MLKRRKLLAVATAVACGIAHPALAQAVAPAGAAPASGKATYPAAFFTAYNPVSAADMVARVPGFELRDGDDRRGFGATAGNVLVNGERPSSKTALSELLKRIPASNVLRIELLDGADASVDVRGQSQIVNVVVNRASRRESSGSYVLALRHIQYSERIGWQTQASRSIPLGETAELALDFQVPNLLGRSEVYDRLTTGKTTPNGVRAQISKPQNIGLQGAAALRWRPTPADSINLNIQYAPTWNDLDTVQLEVGPSGALRSELTGETVYKKNFTAEAGGDAEHRFSSTLSLKVLGVVSNGGVDQHDRFEIFTAPAAMVIRTQDRSTRNGERVGRAQLKWTPTPAHTLEFGIEGAFNFRDTTLDIVNQLNGGAPTPLPLAVADARVEEVRGEASVADIWTVSPKLNLEAGFNFEVSRITQTGDQRKQRSFRYPKPRVVASYAMDARNTFRASLTRDVAQLDFAEFSSAVDFLNTTSIQGNPNLKPERAWKSRIEWDTRLGPRAALTLAAFADAVEDVHDLVDIAGLDAYGNLGDGRRIGAEIRASTPLAMIGLPDAELRLNGLYQKTRVTDPITGRKRSFSVPLERQGSQAGSPTLNGGNKDWAYVVNFRQNLPAISASAGFVVTQWAERREYKRAEVDTYVRERPRLDLFFETTAIKPVTLRFGLNNILVAQETRTRTYFASDRRSGVVQRAERRRVLGGPEGSRIYSVQMSGRF
jgi:hypothetical protein